RHRRPAGRGRAGTGHAATGTVVRTAWSCLRMVGIADRRVGAQLAPLLCKRIPRPEGDTTGKWHGPGPPRGHAIFCSRAIPPVHRAPAVTAARRRRHEFLVLPLDHHALFALATTISNIWR